MMAIMANPRKASTTCSRFVAGCGRGAGIRVFWRARYEYNEIRAKKKVPTARFCDLNECFDVVN